MANEKRLIDANAIKYREKIECCGHGDYRPMHFVTPEDIAKLPTVDAVEVVRCKDCKYHHYICLSGFLDRKDDDFCSYGKRRTE